MPCWEASTQRAARDEAGAGALRPSARARVSQRLMLLRCVKERPGSAGARACAVCDRRVEVRKVERPLTSSAFKFDDPPRFDVANNPLRVMTRTLHSSFARLTARPTTRPQVLPAAPERARRDPRGKHDARSRVSRVLYVYDFCSPAAACGNSIAVALWYFLILWYVFILWHVFILLWYVLNGSTSTRSF